MAREVLVALVACKQQWHGKSSAANLISRDILILLLVQASVLQITLELTSRLFKEVAVRCPPTFPARISYQVGLLILGQPEQD